MKFTRTCIAALALIAAAGCTQIDSGNVGVSTTRGKIALDERPQGTYFTPIETITEFTTKEVSFQLLDLKPKSSDNLTMSDVDIDVYFKATPDKVADTVTKYQGDVVRHKDVVPNSSSTDLIAGYNKVSREARESVYRAVAAFPATTMHTKRDELAAVIRKNLQSELDASDPGVWTVTGINVRNLVTDPAIEKSIRETAERDQQIARANKDKELVKVQAEAKLIEAQGEAAANNAISASLTPQLIRLKEIEAQKAFAGAGTHTVVMGQASGSLVNIGK
jgi:prohibitin 1